MAKWHYFDENGNKVGPIRGRELKELAQQGTVAPNTRVEDEDGRIALAKNVTGLTFPKAAARSPYPDIPTESEEPPGITVPPPPPQPIASNYFYTDENGYKYGPIAVERLQALADRGTITPATSLETDTGRKGLAGQIPGLKFNTVVPHLHLNRTAEPSPSHQKNTDSALFFWVLFGASCFLALAGVWIWIVLTWITLPAALVFLILAVRARDKKTGKSTLKDWGGTAFALAEQATRPAPMQTTPLSGEDFNTSSKMDYKRNRCYFNPNQIGCLPIIVALFGAFLLWNTIPEGYKDITRFESKRKAANDRFEGSRKNATDEFEKAKDRASDWFDKGGRDRWQQQGRNRFDRPEFGGDIDKASAIARLEKERDRIIADARKNRDDALTEIASERASAMTGYLILFLAGLGALAAGAVLIVKALRGNSITDAEMDKICANYVSRNLKPMALEKLGIDEEQVQEIAPIQFHSYYYKNLSSDRADILQVTDLSALKSSARHKSSVQYKMGKDRRYRASNYKAAIFFFSTDQVYYYGLTFSLLDKEHRENTSDNFYGDIVDVSTVSDTVIYRPGVAAIPGLATLLEAILGSVLFGWLSALLFGNKTEIIKFDEFVLTTSGGTSVGATISDLATVERSIQGMKNLVRDKKQQLQR